MEEESILKAIKKLLGVSEEYHVFDQDIILHINSVLNNLQQIGVGPVGGFFITGEDEEWSEFTNDVTLLNSVKTYIYLRVRLLFDLPTTSFAIDAFQKQADMLEWRLNIQAEGAFNGIE